MMLTSTSALRQITRPGGLLLAGLLLAGVLLAPAAHGQQIVPDPGGESCQVTPDCKDYKYDFQPGAGQTFRRWQVRGWWC